MNRLSKQQLIKTGRYKADSRICTAPTRDSLEPYPEFSHAHGAVSRVAFLFAILCLPRALPAVDLFRPNSGEGSVGKEPVYAERRSRRLQELERPLFLSQRYCRQARWYESRSMFYLQSTL